MSMDLIISDTDKVMIASTTPFAGDVVRVDFDAASGVVSLAFAGEDTPDHALPLPVTPRLTAGMIRASRVLLVSLEQGRVSGGYDVPLACTGTV